MLRLFAWWTAGSATMCFACCYWPDNYPLHFVTFLTFVYAFLHFAVEYSVYKSVGSKGLPGAFFVASMLLPYKCIKCLVNAQTCPPPYHSGIYDLVGISLVYSWVVNCEAIVSQIASPLQLHK